MTIAAEQPADLLQTLANNVPLIIAALGFLGGVLALLFIKPPTYKELADEARSLRGERAATDQRISELRRDLDHFLQERATERAADRRTIGLLGDGVDAMWAYIQVLIADMKRYGSPVPQPSEYVEATMRRARQARGDDQPESGPIVTVPSSLDET